MPESSASAVGAGGRFGDRLAAAIAARTGLCLGIDPHPALLAGWDLADDASGLRDFGLRAVDAASPRVGIVKPQVALFERHGAAGLDALAEVLAAARAAGLLVIADAKRGDIGSTMDGYAAAWSASGAPFAADAVTLSPYLGFGSLDGAIATAGESGAGVFVLAATSNPEARALQTAVLGGGAHRGRTVAASIVAEAAARAAEAAERGSLGDVGVVIGATVRLIDYGIRPADLIGVPILAPGFGAQGARLGDLRSLYGDAARQVLASSSRELLAGPVDELGARLDAATAELGA
ncbi:orotidine-5'-phosphate decarboxylase [Schumannella sp. 10F1B-5-1]|uniref:orotidine-5'-phosphate decarboxylase n=1 Tax=Schumannella sp. 10F1B-5-1 TaxID=2590780 RepID=UPI001131C1B6|nr:orotidine-5'-phosphate decarboxylase [Schumannella sp. 10F1B-5-1]TPW71032.1 orotidine-5'-phosphate decarboxylase [Schumannella sp. 10F1B-5-1]